MKKKILVVYLFSKFDEKQYIFSLRAYPNNSYRSVAVIGKPCSPIIPFMIGAQPGFCNVDGNCSKKLYNSQARKSAPARSPNDCQMSGQAWKEAQASPKRK